MKLYNIKSLLVYLILFLWMTPVYADHLVGGEITYECLGGDQYLFTSVMYQDAYNNFGMPDTTLIYVVERHNGNIYSLDTIIRNNIDTLEDNNLNVCVESAPDQTTEAHSFEFQLNLPLNPEGYVIVRQACCRNSAAFTILAPLFEGSTYFLEITREAMEVCNDGPQWANPIPTLACIGYSINYDNSAIDSEGDQLTYGLCEVYTTPFSAPCLNYLSEIYQGGQNVCDVPDAYPPPPFELVPWKSGYGYQFPFGNSVADPAAIDPSTGLFTGTVELVGTYTVGICVEEYRNGVLFSRSNRDFQVTGADCQVTDIQFPPTGYLSCDLEVEFQNATIGATDYFWDFGDGNTSDEAVPTHTYANTGTYDVTLIINQTEPCADTGYATVNVVPPPTADFNLTVDCDILAITASTTSTTDPANPITTYLWDFGDGTTSSQPNPNHTYGQAGSYTILLTTETQAGCADTISQQISLGNGSVSESEYVNCEDNTIEFISTSAGATGFLWDFGDGTTSTEENPVHTYPGLGTYDVVLLITAQGGCTDTVYSQAIILEPASLDFDYVIDCDLKQVSLNSMASSPPANPIISYAWDFGDGNTSSQEDPVHTYAQAGPYTITATIETQEGCTLDYSEDVFLTGPVSTTQGEYLDCDDRNIQFENATEAAQSFLWDFGDGNTSTEEDPSHTYGTYGTYPVTLLVNQGLQCTDTVFLSAVVVPPPTAAFSFALDCDVRQVVFSDSSASSPENPITGYSWDFDDGQTSSQQDPMHIYAQEGNFNVELTISTFGGCSVSQTELVEIGLGPIADFNEGVVCVGTDWQFNNTSSYPGGMIDTYYWLIEGNSIESFETQYLFSDPGNFDVALIAVPTEAEACTDTAWKQMTVRDSLVLDIAELDYSCEGDEVTFANNSTGYYETISWSFGDGSTSNQLSPVHVYSSSGDYTWQVTMTNPACGNETLSDEIEIRDVPIISLSGDGRDICEGVLDSFMVDISAYPGADVLWSTGDTTPFIYVLGGLTELSVVASYQGCSSDPASIELTSECNVFIPSGFMPNGFNNTFNVIPFNIESYELRVYNRWGEQIFSTSEFNRGWDGTWKGLDVPMDNFVYIVDGVKIDQKPFLLSGNVVIIR